MSKRRRKRLQRDRARQSRGRSRSADRAHRQSHTDFNAAHVIEVTQQDIYRAEWPEETDWVYTTNPVALAIARVHGGVVSVYTTILSIRGVYDTPDDVFSWLQALKQGHWIQPIRFTLEKQLEPLPLPDRWHLKEAYERFDPNHCEAE